MTEQISVRKRVGKFTVVSNTAINDERLSLETKGFLLYVCSRPENWVFRPSHLMRVCKIGRDKYYRIVRELKSYGYLRIEQAKNAAGMYLSNTHWDICDDPFPKNPDTAEPKFGKPDHLVNTDTLENTDHIPQHEKPTDDEGGGSNADNTSDEDASAVAEKNKRKLNGHFEEFWREHPRPGDRRGSLKLFNEAVSSGVDPELIKRAAAQYATETEGTNKQFISKSVNWLDERRWENHEARRTKRPDIYEQAVFWADHIAAGKRVHGDSIPIDVQTEMIALGLCTAEEIEAAMAR
ncbi:MAG: hypothetical protein AAFX07_14795 [Pseudomonadota bacterium]